MKSCPGPLRNAAADQDLFLLSRGELPPQRRLSVSMHVLTCSACRARVAEFRRVSDLLAMSFGGGGATRSRLWSLAITPIIPIGILLLAGLFTTAAFVWSSRPIELAPRTRVAARSCHNAGFALSRARPIVASKKMAEKQAVPHQYLP